MEWKSSLERSRSYLQFLAMVLACSLIFMPAQQGANAAVPKQSSQRDAMTIDGLVLLVPSLAMDDLNNLLESIPPQLHPHLRLGGMTLRTVGGLNKVHNIVTLATGQQERLLGGWNGYHQNELVHDDVTALEKYVQLGGEFPQLPIVHPSIFKWYNSWLEHYDTKLEPGWLGEAMEEQGIHTLVLGSSDTQELKKRFASLFIMNAKGQARGNISPELLISDPLFPTGRKADWEKLQQAIQENWKVPWSTLTVVELGDLERIFSLKSQVDGQHFENVFTAWFQDFGEWFATLIQLHEQEQQKPVSIGSRSIDHLSLTEHEQNGKELYIWIVSPWVSQEAQEEGRLLAPILSWNRAQSHGLLSTVTTRQPGIVTNLDFLPTLLHTYHISKPTEIVGQAMGGDALSNELLPLDQQGLHLEPWKSQIEYMFTIYRKRRPIITTYIIIVMLALIATSVYRWFYRHSHGAKVIQMMIGAILFSPVYFLWLTPIIQVIGEFWWMITLCLISLGSSMILYRLCSPCTHLGVISFVNAGALIWDMLQGSVWMKRSFLGYDPIIGARFYGIGNEYAGILLGASIIVVTSCYAWLKSRGYIETDGNSRQQGKMVRRVFLITSSLWYACILSLIGAPQFGTNAGALIACLATFPIAQALLFRYKLKLIQLLLLGACISLGFLGFVFMQLHGEHTHISAVLALIQSGDWQPVFEIAERKWSMNMRLIKVSLWGKLFVISLLILLLFFFRGRRERTGLQRDPWFNGFRSIIVGAVLLLLVNDSGIVAAATAMIFVTFPIIYLRFDEQQRWSTSSKEHVS